MPRAFTDITFTPAVKAAQARYGSRSTNQRLELSEDSDDALTQDEAEFIEARDSFYQATVSENGWPYVQFRGGPPGFLKVLDRKTVAFADFRGNVQYLSVGNITADGRVALILVDYPHRRRLKIWGRARIVHQEEAPDLLAALSMPDYKGRVERAIVIQVAAFDWNCPQHITPRFTIQQVEWATKALRARIADLESQVVALQTRGAAQK